MMQKKLKMTETVANGYSSESTERKLSNEYPCTNMTRFRRFSIIFGSSCFG